MAAHVRRAERDQRGLLVAAALLGGRAAVDELAALRQVRERRHHALDLDQPRARHGLGAFAVARDRAQEAGRVVMAGRREQRLGRRALDDPAGIHHHDLVTGLGDHAEIVGDEQDRHPELALQRAEQIEDLGLDRDVERGGRLVGDQQVRLARERHRDHHALAHPARQLVGIGIDALVGRRDADQPEHLDRDRARFLA
jgi:hypothetical protein